MFLGEIRQDLNPKKKYKGDKSLIAFINLHYKLFAINIILPRRVTVFSVYHRKLDTEWLSSILTDFLLLFTAPW